MTPRSGPETFPLASRLIHFFSGRGTMVLVQSIQNIRLEEPISTFLLCVNCELAVNARCKICDLQSWRDRASAEMDCWVNSLVADGPLESGIVFLNAFLPNLRIED